MYLLRLKSCMYSNSQRAQKLNGRNGSQIPPSIDYILQKQLKMKVLAISHKDTDWLYQIKSTLVQKWVSSKENPQKLSYNFDEAINRKCDDFVYAILVKGQNEIVLIASLFKEYKLTRGLCETYHLQIEYKNCTTQKELYFQSEVVKLLPVYKVTGLAVTESSTFHPHQVLMDIRYVDQTFKGNL